MPQSFGHFATFISVPFLLIVPFSKAALHLPQVRPVTSIPHLLHLHSIRTFLQLSFISNLSVSLKRIKLLLTIKIVRYSFCLLFRHIFINDGLSFLTANKITNTKINKIIIKPRARCGINFTKFCT
jgi:hypothetical protein